MKMSFIYHHVCLYNKEVKNIMVPMTTRRAANGKRSKSNDRLSTCNTPTIHTQNPERIAQIQPMAVFYLLRIQFTHSLLSSAL